MKKKKKSYAPLRIFCIIAHSHSLAAPVFILLACFFFSPTQVGLPSDKAQYIHRLGRTARAGKAGHGILLLCDFESVRTPPPALLLCTEHVRRVVLGQRERGRRGSREKIGVRLCAAVFGATRGEGQEKKRGTSLCALVCIVCMYFSRKNQKGWIFLALKRKENGLREEKKQLRLS